eukprot:5018230-Pyramimonas_sp.AAC.1
MRPKSANFELREEGPSAELLQCTWSNSVFARPLSQEHVRSSMALPLPAMNPASHWRSRGASAPFALARGSKPERA